MVIEPHMKQGRQHKLISTIFLATSVTKKLDHNNATAEPAKTVEVKSHTRQRKPKATRKELYANLPVREIVIPLTEEERRCPYCNAEMTTIGYTDVREELRITPAKVERILYKQEVAVCPECRKDGDGTLVKAATETGGAGESEKLCPGYCPGSPGL